MLQRHIEIVQGNDYLGGRALSATGDAWGDDIASVRLFVWPRCGSAAALPVLDVEGTYTAPTTTSPAKAVIPLPRSETIKLAEGARAHSYEIKGLTAANQLVTLERGAMSVLRGGL